MVLREYGDPGRRYREPFECRYEPLPNWTSHLFLAAALGVFPPAVAEKLLVSACVVGLAAAVRYYLASFGPGRGWLACAGVLFVYNRCLLMGFYNYCLGLGLAVTVFAWVARGRDRGRGAACLSALLTACYFTHLVAFALAAGGALFFATTAGPARCRVRRGFAVALAAAPGIALTCYYLSPALTQADADRGFLPVFRRGTPARRSVRSRASTREPLPVRDPRPDWVCGGTLPSSCCSSRWP